MSALAHSLSIKMFGFLKKLSRKTPDTWTDSTSATPIKPTVEAVAASSPNSYSFFRRTTVRKNLGPHNGNGKSVEVSVQKVLAVLPLELRSQIRQANVGEQTISVPVGKILAQLSRGAVKVSFGELRQGAPGVFTAENDRDWVLVSLPLADILSQLDPALITRRVQHQVEVPADIGNPFDPSRPGLFAGDEGGQTQAVASAIPLRQVSPAPFAPAAPERGGVGFVPPPSQPAMLADPTAHQSPPSAPTAPTSSPPTVPLAPLRLTPSALPPMPPSIPTAKAAPALSRSSVAPASAAQPSDSNYYTRDDSNDAVMVHESEVKRPTPGTKLVAKYATPNEVVSRAAALDGVAGALIALPDGLMVANRLPPGLNADTLAAFLPQIFGKVSQCTKELRLGDLNNLNFTVGNVPWKIFRVNAIFFAAFGREGEPFPTSQLAALAAELDHKPK